MSARPRCDLSAFDDRREAGWRWCRRLASSLGMSVQGMLAPCRERSDWTTHLWIAAVPPRCWLILPYSLLPHCLLQRSSHSAMQTSISRLPLYNCDGTVVEDDKPPTPTQRQARMMIRGCEKSWLRINTASTRPQRGLNLHDFLESSSTTPIFTTSPNATNEKLETKTCLQSNGIENFGEHECIPSSRRTSSDAGRNIWGGTCRIDDNKCAVLNSG